MIQNRLICRLSDLLSDLSSRFSKHVTSKRILLCQTQNIKLLLNEHISASSTASVSTDDVFIDYPCSHVSASSTMLVLLWGFVHHWTTILTVNTLTWSTLRQWQFHCRTEDVPRSLLRCLWSHIAAFLCVFPQTVISGIVWTHWL